MKRLPGKTRIVRGVTYLGFSCIFFILGCNSRPPASSPAADEAAVRQTDENWSKAAQSKKVDDWVAFYAKDAVLYRQTIRRWIPRKASANTSGSC